MNQHATSRKPGSRPIPGISIVGLGNWGNSLAHALRAAAIPVREVIRVSHVRVSRSSGPGLRFSERGFPVITLDRARLDAAVLWLCVPDSAIAQVVKRMVEQRQGQANGQALQGQTVVHSSGALSAAVLQPAALAGARIASVHPLMTFPTRAPVSLNGVPFAIEADQPTRRKLSAIVRKLGGRPFAISGQGKALYHAMGMLASPLLVSLMAAAEQTAHLAGLAPRQARRLIEPIAQATLKNIFSQGAVNSFSGPIARGDKAAIHLHLEALLPHPMLTNVYRSLALYALEVLPAQHREEIRRALGGANRKRAMSAASRISTQHEKLNPRALKRKSATL